MVTIKTTKMSEREQIIIPKNIREYIQAEENTIFSNYKASTISFFLSIFIVMVKI